MKYDFCQIYKKMQLYIKLYIKENKINIPLM